MQRSSRPPHPVHRIGSHCVTALLVAASPAHADTYSCRSAVERYNSATSDVADALRRYARCIDSSAGHDDCSAEFRRVRNAQSDFESAVNEYQSECD
jgi:hypothetical protein